MSKNEKYTPTDRVINHCEFILSVVDQDIADEFRSYGHGMYNPDSPLLVQLSRCLRKICNASFSGDSVRNINDADKGNNNCGND